MRTIIGRFLIVAALLALPLVAPAQVVTSSSTKAKTWTATAPSGAAGFVLNTGAKLCLDSNCARDLHNEAGGNLVLTNAATLSVGSNGSNTSFMGMVAACYPGRCTGGLTVAGRDTNTSLAAGVTIRNETTLNQPGGKVLKVCADSGCTSEVFGVWAPGAANGGIYVSPSTLGTCGTTGAFEGTLVVIAGAATTRTKWCVCTNQPTGTGYVWVNMLANNAGTGIGTNTTCP